MLQLVSRARAALKVIPPILLCWPTTSEADVGGMAIEVEPSHQYCYILLPCDRWQQKGSLTEWHLTWKCVRIPLWGNKWHPLTFIDTCWIFMGTKQQMWAQWGGVWYSSGNRDSGSPPLVQIFTSMACRLLSMAKMHSYWRWLCEK